MNRTIQCISKRRTHEISRCISGTDSNSGSQYKSRVLRRCFRWCENCSRDRKQTGFRASHSSGTGCRYRARPGRGSLTRRHRVSPPRVWPHTPEHQEDAIYPSLRSVWPSYVHNKARMNLYFDQKLDGSGYFVTIGLGRAHKDSLSIAAEAIS